MVLTCNIGEEVQKIILKFNKYIYIFMMKSSHAFFVEELQII